MKQSKFPYRRKEAPKIILPDRFTGGQRRFACECGQKLYEPHEGILHAFAGHQVVVETSRNGQWYFDHVTVMDKICEAMREPGESWEQFTRRIQAWADRLEREAKTRGFIEQVRIS